jgi:hypothetical protein
MISRIKYQDLKQIARGYKPLAFIKIFGFSKSVSTACSMLNNEEGDENLQQYATNLLEELKRTYIKKWNADWKYDALLGYAYDITLQYDRRYAAYKRAFDKANPPSPQLLIALAGCCWAPGKPHITEEEAISLTRQAIKDIFYIEGVELLRGLYKSTGNIKEQEYWEHVLEGIKDSGVHLPALDQVCYDG